MADKNQGRPAPHSESDAANLARTGNAASTSGGDPAANAATLEGAGDDGASTLGQRHGEGDFRHGEIGRDGRRAERPRQSSGEQSLGVNSPQRHVEEARAAADRRQQKLSDRNAEVQDRLNEEEAKKYENHGTIDGEDGAIGAPDKKLGREDNGNTPILNEDGSKSWMPPSVAGSVR